MKLTDLKYGWNICDMKIRKNKWFQKLYFAVSSKSALKIFSLNSGIQIKTLLLTTVASKIFILNKFCPFSVFPFVADGSAIFENCVQRSGIFQNEFHGTLQCRHKVSWLHIWRRRHVVWKYIRNWMGRILIRLKFLLRISTEEALTQTWSQSKCSNWNGSMEKTPFLQS